MALLQDLIQQIDDPALRERILQETNKLVKQKKFGLVFEEHLPECTPLYDVPIRVGSKVARKTGYVSDIYTVLKIDGSTVLCDRRETHEQVTFQMGEIVAIAEFGEPIYPTLTPLDYVENAPDSDLWHTLIEADNYHALQLLEYLYAEKVDCIYIDPPYNTGAKDWKYNNDYVDNSDAYRHSKWLSMMEKRLKLAKKLLNPEDSVLIVTIDEKEYLHLGCLLEELFPEANRQMITSVISRNGTSRANEFSRVEEYIFILRIGRMGVVRTNDNMLSEDGKGVISRVWFNFMRTSTSRSKTKGQFFPIYINPSLKKIESIGDPLSLDENYLDIQVPEGLVAVFPIRDDGTEATWGAIPETARELLENGYLRMGAYDKKTNRWSIQYVREGDRKRVESGEIIVVGKAEDESLILSPVDATQRSVFPKTVWNRKSHDATEYGTRLLKPLFINSRFSYPKSLYAVADSLKFFVSDKPNALIVDFFAGSGTTLHAVNLLNSTDNGRRRCILVTNNEVSEAEAKILAKQGYHPGDEEWDKLGIARYVTWPRTCCSIKGDNIKGFPLTGTYGCDVEQYVEIEGEVTDPNNGKKIRGTVYKKKKVPAYPELAELKMSDGFKTNAAFFKLSFLDKTSVALGRQFKELLPVLWMKGGAIGKCPTLNEENLPNMLILPMNKMAVLIDEIYYPEFDEQINLHSEIQTVFIVTDSEPAYREMIRNYNGKDCYQLYRDYLDNFRINTGR